MFIIDERMTVAIFGKSVNDHFLPVLIGMLKELKSRGVELICEFEFSRFLAVHGVHGDLFSGVFDKNMLLDGRVDLLLSVGGDGTFLDSVVYVKDSGIPILGINSGRLGFLANISEAGIDEAIECICTGNYLIEKRDLLELTVDGERVPNFTYALNEVGILKTEISSLLNIHAYIEDVYLTTYWADGLILATPTGSTAYSLSGGGPIVSPSCKNVILTPICPHNLSMRPLVLPAGVNIQLRVEGRSGNFMLSMDSRMRKMEDSAVLCVTPAGFQIHLITLPTHNYYETLRQKLMWGEDRRNGKV